MCARPQNGLAFRTFFFFDFVSGFPLFPDLQGNIAAFNERGFIAKGIDLDLLVELGGGEQILKTLRDSNDAKPAADRRSSVRLLFQAGEADHPDQADILEVQDERPVSIAERIKSPFELNRTLAIQVAFQRQCRGSAVMDALDPHFDFRPTRYSPTTGCP